MTSRLLFGDFNVEPVIKRNSRYAIISSGSMGITNNRSKMAASVLKLNNLQMVLTLLFYLLSPLECEEVTIRNTQVIQESIFSDLLLVLHGQETQLHRCTFQKFQANETSCLVSASSYQTHFTFPSVAAVFDSQCETKLIYDCMQNNDVVNVLVNFVRDDIEKTVEDVCCTLQHCVTPNTDKLATIHKKSNARLIRERETSLLSDRKRKKNVQQERPSSAKNSSEKWEEVCFNCAMVSEKETKGADKKHRARLKVLQNMTCTKKTFNNFSCRQLNIIALNILSANGSKKLQDDAKDMIRNCNPGFYNDPVRTFSVVSQTLTEEELSQLSTFFSSDEPETKEITKKKPGKVFGVIILVAVVIASLVVIGWLIKTRLFKDRGTSTTSPNILYSRIDYNDEDLDDYSNDGEQSMFERDNFML